MPTNRELTKNLLLLAATLLVIFLATEAALRYRVYVIDRDYFLKREETQKEIVTSEAGSIIKHSDNKKLMFALKPEIRFNHVGAEVFTNREGFRDFNYDIDPPPGTVRIVGLGDSLMYGQGVDQQLNYLAIMESYLNQKIPSRQWDVINTALFDYNTVMEVETLREKGLKYSPDLVVLGFCSNDLYVPWGVRTISDYFSLKTSYIAEFVRQRLDPLAPAFTTNLDRHMHLAGKTAFQGALDELKEMSGTNGFQVLVVFITGGNRKVTQYAMVEARKRGFHVLDTDPAIRSYMKTLGINTYAGSMMTIPDGHPSDITHGTIAMTIIYYMDKSGILKSILSKTSVKAP